MRFRAEALAPPALITMENNDMHRTSSLLAIAVFTAALVPAFAAAHETVYSAILDGDQVVNPDGSIGVDTDATGILEMQADEHTEVFDVYELTVDGIFIDDLDHSHGPNGTAFHIRLGGATERGPIVIDLGWYIGAGFGAITPTATGFSATVSAVLLSQQGAYDMTGTTGLSPHDVIHEMEEGNTYIAVHTHDHHDGEIRGSLEPVEETPTDRATWARVKATFQAR